MPERTATCACGKLIVTCSGDPTRISVCHCLDCQRRTGSTYVIGAFFARNDVEANGSFRTFRRDSDSGSAVSFHFCPDCGSTVFWEPEQRPDMVAVAVGAFADPAFPAPSQSAFNERRHSWVPPLACGRCRSSRTSPQRPLGPVRFAAHFLQHATHRVHLRAEAAPIA